MNFENVIPETDGERAVSPVIGVILMVAITVILAAVIGTFVLGLGDQVSQTAPTASITVEDYSTADDTVLLGHGGGDTIEASETDVIVAGTDFSASNAPSDGSLSTADTMLITGNGTYDISWGAPHGTSEFSTYDGGTTFSISEGDTVTLVDTGSGQIIAERELN